MYFIHISNGKFVTLVYDERIAPVVSLIKIDYFGDLKSSDNG